MDVDSLLGIFRSYHSSVFYLNEFIDKECGLLDQALSRAACLVGSDTEKGRKLKKLRDTEENAKTDYETLKTEMETAIKEVYENNQIEEDNSKLHLNLTKTELYDAPSYMTYKNRINNVIKYLNQYIELLVYIREEKSRINLLQKKLESNPKNEDSLKKDIEKKELVVFNSLIKGNVGNKILVYKKILDTLTIILKILNGDEESIKQYTIQYKPDPNNDIYTYIYNFSDRCIQDGDYEELEFDSNYARYMEVIVNSKNDEKDKILLNKNKSYSIEQTQEFIKPVRWPEGKSMLKKLDSKPIYYFQFESDTKRLCKQIHVTESGGNQKDIDTINFNVEIGIDTTTKKFVIFRWGLWREFDPFNYIIKLKNTRGEYFVTEEGKNPFNDNKYNRGNINFHTILRKLYSKIEGDKPVYYDIRTRTFFNDECEPLIMYYNDINISTEQHKQMLKNICVNHNIRNFDSTINVNLLKTILNPENRKYYLFPFVKEFGGAMDTLIKYGNFLRRDTRNLAEELIWDFSDEEKRTSRDCSKPDQIERKGAKCNLPA